MQRQPFPGQKPPIIEASQTNASLTSRNFLIDIDLSRAMNFESEIHGSGPGIR
jgi:hypothetical protein